MAAPKGLRPKLVALDTNVWFHLAEQYAPAHNLILRLVRNGFTPIITQTVVIADVIAARKLLPEDERHDAYILIEAGMVNVSMLIPWDQHLLAASNSALNEVLVSFDLHPAQVTAPRVVLGY